MIFISSFISLIITIINRIQNYNICIYSIMVESSIKLTVIDKCSICMEEIPKEINPQYKNSECGHQCCKK